MMCRIWLALWRKLVRKNRVTIEMMRKMRSNQKMKKNKIKINQIKRL
jgi:hypothetical protein